MTNEHLHLIREKQPDARKEYKFLKVWCPHCEMWIWVIHLDLAPENPKEAKPEYVCPARNTCPYNYDACHDPKKFCRIIEDTPEHYSKTMEGKKEAKPK
jgi:hypothetical protein